MPNGATPLGYGAAVLPKSSFDPLEFGQQVAAIEAGKVKTKKENAKKLKDAAVESMNPELGKLKWTSPFVNQYENKIKDFRKRNVDWYKTQDGKLTSEQIQSNRQFTNETKGEFELLNTVYDDFVKTKNNVFTNKAFNTPENLKEIERFNNPYKNDPKGLAEVDGDLLAYIAANPLQVKPKVEDIDIVNISKDINDLAGTAQVKLEPYTDQLSGQIIHPEITSGRPERVAAMAEQKWRTTPSLREQYPNMEDFQSAIAIGIQGDERKDKFVKPIDDDKAVKKVGRATVSGGLKVSQDQKDLQLPIKRVIKRKGGITVPSPLTGEEERIMKETIPSEGYAISTKTGQPVNVSTFLNNVSVITEDGVVNMGAGGQNYDMKVNSVRHLPTANSQIDVKALADSPDKELLMQRAKNGNIEEGTILTPREAIAYRNLNIGDAITDSPYAFGEVKNLEEKFDKEDNKFYKKSISNAFLVPYEDVRGGLKNIGFELPETKPRDTGNQRAIRVKSKKTGKEYLWDNATGEYKEVK